MARLEGSIALLGAVAVLIGWILYTLRTSSVQKSLRLSNGHIYGYEVGNRLARGRSYFRGARVALPASLPQIYIDAHSGDWGRGARYFMPRDQALSLEGNFDADFQVYVPKGQQVLALSILTPDVMEAIQKVATHFDVEIVGSELRVLSHHRPYKHPEREAELIAAVTLLTTELDHRLASWSQANSDESLKLSLQQEDNPTVKLGKRPVRFSTILLGAIYGLLGVLIWGIMLGSWSHDRVLVRSGMILNGAVAFAIFPVLWMVLIYGVPRGWFNWVGLFVER